MKISYSSYVPIFLVLFTVLSFNAHASKPLRFELTITDFYNPFLTATENEQIKKQFLSQAVNISGIYSAKSGRHYQANCMVGVTCSPFGGKWINDYVHQKQTSIIIAYDTSLHKVIFDLPQSIKFKKLNLKLKSIEIKVPTGYTIHMPYQQGKKTYNNIKGTSLVQRSLNKPMVTGAVLAGYAGIAVQMSVDNTKLNAYTPFTQQEKNRLFGYTHLLDYGGYVKLAIPDTLPHWQNMGRDDGYGKPTGVWLHDKQNRLEAVSLKGRVYYAPSDSFDKYEIWLKTNNQLSHIYSDPIYFEEHQCGIVYGAIFYPDGTEQRYFIPKLSFGERSDAFAIETKKKVVSPHDLSLLTEFEKSKEDYYLALEKGYGRDRQADLVACKRIINDAKHILSSPRTVLENEYAQFKKLIQDATPKKVKAIGGIYGANDRQIFYGNSVIKGADAKSFRVLNEPCPIVDRPTIKCSQHVREDERYAPLILAKDNNHVYERGQIFKNDLNIYLKTPRDASKDVDAKSFQLFYIYSRNYYYIDKYRIYRLSAGAVNASFDTQGTVYGPIGKKHQFVFLDDNGFFEIEGDRVGLCTEYFDGLKYNFRGTKGKIIPLAKTPEGVTWAVEDDNFEYYLTDVESEKASYMIDKKTREQYLLFMLDGRCSALKK